jgi:hypothetical protein
MKIEINKTARKQKMFLSSEAILRYLITDNEKLDTLIMCKSSEISLFTSDHNLYEAIASIKPEDTFKLNKLAKLLEVGDIVPHNKVKSILKHERVEEIRKIALTENKDKPTGGTENVKN